MKRQLFAGNLQLAIISLVALTISCKNRSANHTNATEAPAAIQDTSSSKAIHHGSENQATLDSIKAAKEKGK